MEILAPVVKNIIYPLWLFKNNNRELKYLMEYKRTQFYTPNQIKDLQWQRLQTLLDHAYKTCPFYTKHFKRVDINPSDIRTPADMLRVPILTKSEIQNYFDELKSNCYREEDLIRDKTGGSTGSPLVFYYNKERVYSRAAAAARHDRWTTWDIGKKMALLWGAASDLSGFNNIKGQIRNAVLNRKIVLDASSITEEQLRQFVKTVKRYKPNYFLSYANAMVLFARFIKENNITGIHPTAIITSAEVLTSDNRSLIENVFGCKVYNRYGCREFSVIASECSHHMGMHINAENLYVEFVKNGRHADPGETGEIIITDLLNYGMPMIRYKIGDMGSPIDKTCTCGRGLPLMNMIGGRVTDFIVTPDGKLVSGVAIATYVITNIAGIKQIQFVQETKEHVKIRLVRNNDFSGETLDKLNKNIVKFLGDKIKSEIEYVYNIPSEQSGKYLFSISTVQTNF
jgi:phenylacetate-CoA ligase